MSEKTFYGYHSSKNKKGGWSDGKIDRYYEDVIRSAYMDIISDNDELLENNDIEGMASAFEDAGYGFTFVSTTPIEASVYQVSKYKYGDYLYKVYGTGNEIIIDDPNEVNAEIIVSKTPLFFEAVDEINENRRITVEDVRTLSYLKDKDPIKDTDKIRVYHGFNYQSDAIIALQKGLSGKVRATRVYSYETGNNPKGLFVSVSFFTVKERFAHSGIIIEFETIANNLEAPVWAGQDSFYVQGQYTKSFASEEEREAERIRKREKYRLEDPEPERYSNNRISKSDRPELADTLFNNPEKQALFIGDLNPNEIKTVWYNEGLDIRRVTNEPWVRYDRKSFLRKYGDRLMDKTKDDSRHDHSQRKIFKPQDDLNLDLIKKKASDEVYDFEVFIKYLKKDIRAQETYLWPKQIEQFKKMNLNQPLQETTLGSVFGAPGDPNGGIFVGKLSGVSSKVMRRRLLYPTYKNSTGKNTIIKNALNEEYLYNEQGQPLTGKDIERICELGLSNRLSFNGGKFVKIEPKCAAFPYCNQGAIDKPIKLISGTKEGMCEGCNEYCNSIAEQAGKSVEYVAEGFRNYALKKLEEITVKDYEKTNQFLTSIQNTVESTLFSRIKQVVAMNIIDPYITFEELFNKINTLLIKNKGLKKLSESIESLDNNKTKKNINEMNKVKNLSVKHRKEIMESMLKSEVGKCMQEQLQNEGFLPLNEELNDSLTLEESFNTMMEDDDLVNEMFDALQESDCECSESMNKFIKEQFGEEETEEPAEETPSEEETEETTEETPSEEETEETTEPDFGGDAAEPVTDVTDEIPDVEEPAEGAEQNFQSLIDTLVGLQTKFASDENAATTLDAINDMLNNAKALKDQELSTGSNIPGEAVAGIEIELPGEELGAGLADDIDVPLEDETPELDDNAPMDDISVDGEVDPTVEPSLGDQIADDLAESIDSEVDSVIGLAKAPKVAAKAGGANKKSVIDTFVDRVKDFVEVFKEDIKFNSFCEFYKLPQYEALKPEFGQEGNKEEMVKGKLKLFDSILSYYTPQIDETAEGFMFRITDLNNDPYGLNYAFLDMIDPAKRRYFQNYARTAQNNIKNNNKPGAVKAITRNKVDDMEADNKIDKNRGVYDELQMAASAVNDKYALILSGSSSVDLDAADGEDLDDTDTNPFVKDDFETELPDDDNIAVQAQKAAAGQGSDPSTKTRWAKADDDFEDDEISLDDDGNVIDSNGNLLEQTLPVIAPNVMSTNKETAKENEDLAKDAIDSQKTVEQKVDNLKNQKYKPSEAQETILGKMHGMNNNLDLDYDTALTPERKKQILDQAKGLAPADHANVDHESTAGQKLIDAAKDRAPQTDQNYTSKPDTTSLTKVEPYEVTTAVNEDLERIKKLMKFDSTKLKENKLRSKVDEEKFLIERVQKKKFL